MTSAAPDEWFSLRLDAGPEVQAVSTTRAYRALATTGTSVEGVFGWAAGSDPVVTVVWRDHPPPLRGDEVEAATHRVTVPLV